MWTCISGWLCNPSWGQTSITKLPCKSFVLTAAQISSWSELVKCLQKSGQLSSSTANTTNLFSNRFRYESWSGGFLRRSDPAFQVFYITLFQQVITTNWTLSGFTVFYCHAVVDIIVFPHFTFGRILKHTVSMLILKTVLITYVGIRFSFFILIKLELTHNLNNVLECI